MRCYFKIQLPGGEFIRIPSSVNLVDNVDSLKELLKTYYSDEQIDFHNKYKTWLNSKNIEDDTFKKDYSDQISELKSITSSIISRFDLNILPEDLENIIINSNSDELIDDINNFIRGSITKDSFEDSIRRWLYSKNPIINKKGSKNVTTSDLNTFVKLISKKVTPPYFEELPFLDIVGKSSINDEINNLSDKIEKLENQYEVSSSIQKDIKSVLKALNKFSLIESNILFGITRTGSENDTLVIPKSESSNGFIFYNKNNDLSLFLAVFKYLSSVGNWSELNSEGITHEDALKNLIRNWNDWATNQNIDKIELRNFSPIKFFCGDFKKEEGKEPIFRDAKFHKMIKNFSSKYMNELIDILVDTLNVNNSSNLKSAIKRTIKYIDPKKYGENIFSAQQKAASEYDEQSIKNQELRNELIGRNYGNFAKSSERTYHYSYTMNITKSKDNLKEAYLELLDSIELGKDLVKVRSEKRDKMNYKTPDIYVIPTKITLLQSGIYVVGITTEDGKFTVRSYEIPIIDNKISIDYRKFETEDIPILNTIPPKLENAFLIKSTEKLLSPAIVKNYVEVGSIIKYVNSKGVEESPSIVTAVYPGQIQIKGSKYPINYDRILEINTTKLTEDDRKDWRDSDFGSMLSVSGKSAEFLPTRGDIIKFDDKGITRINKVLDSDDNNVYIVINTENNESYVNKIPRNIIKEAFINFERINIDTEINSVFLDNLNIVGDKSIRNNKYSYSENIEESKDGDILMMDSEEGPILFKLLDKKRMKVVQRLGLNSKEYKLQILSKSSPIKGIFTTRDISESNALDIARINERKLFINEDNNLQVVYLIPKGLKLEDGLLFDSLHFNIGITIEKSYYENNLDKYEDYEDVTSLALKIISKKLNKSVKSINFKSISESLYENIHERHIDDLFKINSFDKFSHDNKISLIQEGAYVRLKSNTSEKKIYRISKDLGDEVLLEYSILSPFGEIKTIRKYVSKEDLIENIKYFYLIKGNSKIPSIIKQSFELEKDFKKDIRTKEEIREAFVFSIEKVLSPLGISVVQLNAEEGGFENGQKAKIQNGKIIINKDNSSEEDVIHEFLHVFLIGLKYSDSESYSNLLLSFWHNKSKLGEKFFSTYNIDPETIVNLDQIEEVFVRALANMLANNDDIDLSTMENIESALIISISNMGLNTGNFIASDLYGILKTPIKDILNIKETSKRFTNLLSFEASFREWVEKEIENNKLEINCI